SRWNEYRRPPRPEVTTRSIVSNMKRLVVLFLLVLASLSAAPNLVILVRHAEKASTPETDPPLSDAGRQRALKLPRILETWTATGARVRALFATELQRTQQTLAPLAACTHVHVTVVKSNNTAELVKKVLAAPAGIVVIAGHSNTVPEIIEALGGPSNIE